MKIGIAITTRNRPEVFDKCYSFIKKYAPERSVIVVIDDCSETPVKKANFRFNKNAGIATAKNKGIELLYTAGCTHFFLFDDDVWPVKHNWWKPYVESTEPHLMFTFSTLKDGRPNGNREVVSSNDLTVFSNPCGCMLYFNRSVVDTIGGFDVNFNPYGYEHVEFSNRIHNAKLTKNAYQDIPNSLELFHSMDWACEIKSSVQENRSYTLYTAKKYFDSVRHNSGYIAFMPLPNTILTTLNTTLIDPQRGTKWEGGAKVLDKLIKSVEGHDLVVLTDFMKRSEENLTFEQVPIKNENPYWQRWYAIRDWLIQNKREFVFCVDGSDVEMYKNPFPEMEKGKLYVGDERYRILRNGWLMGHHPQKVFQRMYEVGFNWTLLNAGLVGGDYETVLEFLNLLLYFYEKQKGDVGKTDMAAFNFVAYAEFKDKLMYGDKICTVFTKEEQRREGENNPWFKHK